MTRVSIIVAVAQNGVIGVNNALPWRLAEDLAHFKRTTMGHPIIMGRKTFESIGRALPGRRNIVVTRNRDWQAAGVEAAASLDAALALCSTEPEAFIIGGESLYAEGLGVAQRLYLTEVHRSYVGDARFPSVPGQFREVARQAHRSSADPLLQFDFVILDRMRAEHSTPD